MARGGGRDQSKRAVPHPRRWVVERGLPRLLSVSRTSGLRHPFFFLLFSLLSFLHLPLYLSLVLFLSSTCTPAAPLSHTPLRPSSLSLPFYSALGSSQPFYSAISFPRQRFFFLPSRPVCSPPFLPVARALPSTRAFPASPALRVPTACVSTAKSIDRNVWPERYEGNRRKWGVG